MGAQMGTGMHESQPLGYHCGARLSYWFSFWPPPVNNTNRCFCSRIAAGHRDRVLDRQYMQIIQMAASDKGPIRIATAPELWFEKPGNSPPVAPPAEERRPTRGA